MVNYTKYGDIVGLDTRNLHITPDHVAFAIIDDVKYLATTPMIKTEHKDGEISISGFYAIDNGGDEK